MAAETLPRIVVAKLFREQNVVVKLMLIKTVVRGASKDAQVSDSRSLGNKRKFTDCFLCSRLLSIGRVWQRTRMLQWCSS